MSGLRTALRVARRDAWRHKVTSLLVLAMIALPVAAVTAAAVVWKTQEISGTEAIETRLGGAAAKVEVYTGAPRVYQGFDPADRYTMGGDGAGDTLTLTNLRQVLGPDRPALELREEGFQFPTELGSADAMLTVVDLGDPLADGLVRLVDGRLPSTPGEIAVTRELLDRGPAVGDDLDLTFKQYDGTTLPARIVGVIEHGRVRDRPLAVALPGLVEEHAAAQGGAETTTYLVGGGPVAWPQVLELNRLGAAVTSRAVLADPPPESALEAEVRYGYSVLEGPLLTVAALVVVMVLLEVVLLAGPAFAVGARRQARTLALIAAAGGTPRQARRVILASGLVFGVAAAVVGVLLGIGLAALAEPFAQRTVGHWFGPFQVPWGWVALVAAFGVLSALLAAVVPAWAASRQDVVAVLAGRRGDAPISFRSPVVGLLVFAAGVVCAVLGARRVWQYEVLIAASALICVLGMLLCIPLVVARVARLAARMPLPLRFAARDAARHRTRTVPAVAAVAATVAGVVALGIAVTSDEEQARRHYAPRLPEGLAAVTTWAEDPDWERIEELVAAHAPDVSTSLARGVRNIADDDHVELALEDDGQEVWLLDGWSSGVGSGQLVADRTPEVLDGVPPADRRRADEALAAGGMVVFSDGRAGPDRPTLLVRTWDAETGEPSAERRVDVPVTVVGYDGVHAPAWGVLSPAAAAAAGVTPQPVGLVLTEPIDREAQAVLTEVFNPMTEVDFYVERGYQTPDEVLIIQLVLGVLGAVMMLGGTLTATFLALSDARPDLATLAAVGAEPRTRRLVGAAYALGIGLVGALLGALVGTVPGIAVTYPLTGWSAFGGGESGHVVAVPWLLVGVVVLGLPLLTAAVVGLFARSRLPVVARID